MTFAQLLQKNKDNSTLTNEEIGNLLFATNATVSNWLNDKTTPPLSKDNLKQLKAIAAFCHVSLNELAAAVNESNGITLESTTENDNGKSLADKLFDLEKYKLSACGCKELLRRYLRKELGEREKNFSENLNALHLSGTVVFNSIFDEYKGVKACNAWLEIADEKAAKWVIEYLVNHGCEYFDAAKLVDADAYTFLSYFYNLDFYYDICSNGVLIKDDRMMAYHDMFNINIRSSNYNKTAAVAVPVKAIIDEGSVKDIAEDISDRLDDYYFSRPTVENEIKNWIRNLPYLPLNNSFFTAVKKVSSVEKETYKAELCKYEEELFEWNRKMQEIRKLQDLYDSEKYPDLPMPKKPQKPEGETDYVLTRRGELLIEFCKSAHLNDNNSEIVERAENYRYALKPYIGEKVTVNAIVAKVEENEYILLRDVYKGDIYVSDHLYAYKYDIEIQETELSIGCRYCFTGVVYEYINSHSKSNLGVDISAFDNYLA